MHIGFLLGSSGISGGTNVIIEHGSRLCQMGHRVSVITIVPVQESELSWHNRANELEWLTLAEAGPLRFDILLATWWQSVALLKQLQADTYLYFVQSIESRFFPPQDESILENRDIDVLREWCESSYGFPLPVITEASWIRDYLKEKYNSSVALVKNGIRKDIYTRTGVSVAPREEGRLRVLVEGPLNVFFKNVEKTIELCRQSKADEIWLLSSSEISDYSGVDRCFSRVPIEKTAEIYRSCDVLVKLSYVEGMFGPPLEMFHCGGTALVYDVTGHDEYIEHESNGLVVSRDDEKAVVAGINRFKDNPDFLEKLKSRAAVTAEQWPDWPQQAERFANTLEALASVSRDASVLIGDYTDKAAFVRDNHFKAREYGRMVNRESSWGQQSQRYTNFIQVYYHQGEGFTNEAMVWENYQDNEWCTCSVKLPKCDNPLFLRLDPSVRIGMVSIRSVQVKDTGTGKILGQWNPGTGFEALHIDGTCQCFDQKTLLRLFSFGEDPQLHLPGTYISANDSQLELKVELCEKGLCETFKELSENPLKRKIKKILNICRSKLSNSTPPTTQ